MPATPADPPSPDQGRIDLLEPPEPKPSRDLQHDEVGYLILVLWKTKGTTIRNETFEIFNREVPRSGAAPAHSSLSNYWLKPQVGDGLAAGWRSSSPTAA